MSASPCDLSLEPDEPTTGNYFVSTYPPFSCWNESITEVYRRTLGTAPSAPRQTPLGLYVHIPFCVDRCHYCYYLSTGDRMEEMDRYLAALAEEAALYAATPAIAGRALDFVYFGGGTPSLLSSSRLELLIGDLQRSFSWDAVREVTFECAPKSVTEAKLEVLRRSGVTRLSLGVQQMNDDVLRANGRVHLVSDIERAYRAIRKVGFDVVNIDLMVGLVRETEATYQESLRRVIELEPDSVTTYQLEIPLNTPLYRSIRDGALADEIADWKVKRARLARGMERLEGAGYTVSSAYAALRDPDRHAFVYQIEQYHGADLLGIGSSAFSHLAGINQQNQTRLGDYLAAVESHAMPLWRGHVLTVEERMVREFVLQLKLGEAKRDYFMAKFDVDILERFASPLDELEKSGWLESSDAGIVVTREGLLRVDRLLPSFYLPEHRGIRYS